MAQFKRPTLSKKTVFTFRDVKSLTNREARANVSDPTTILPTTSTVSGGLPVLPNG